MNRPRRNKREAPAPSEGGSSTRRKVYRRSRGAKRGRQEGREARLHDARFSEIIGEQIDPRFKAAATGESSSLGPDDWLRLEEAWAGSELATEDSGSFRILRIPKEWSWIRIGAPTELTVDFCAHAEQVMPPAGTKKAERPSGADDESTSLSGEAEQGRPVSEWLFLKRFLHERLSKVRKVAGELVDQMMQLQGELRDASDMSKLLYTIKDFHGQLVAFDTEVIDGTWVGSVFRDYAWELLGISFRPFLSIFLTPDFCDVIDKGLLRLVNWSVLPMPAEPRPEIPAVTTRTIGEFCSLLALGNLEHEAELISALIESANEPLARKGEAAC